MQEKEFRYSCLVLILFTIIVTLILILGAIKLTNEHLETIIKLEKRQNAKTPETTTPELVIEENTLGR